MKMIIAPQAFKGSLSALDAAKAIRDGVLSVFPTAECCLSPVADGGDGTLEVLMQIPSSTLKTTIVSDALGKKIKAPWGIFNNGTAVIELASICGLAQLPSHHRNPLITTTYGVGEVIKAALDEGFRQFLIGVGGTATQDGGAGLAQALGACLKDKDGHELAHGGERLIALDSIDTSGLDPRLNESQFLIACDVTNPLVGPEGSAAIYAPQKGASSEVVEKLEKALINFAHVVKRDLALDVSSMPRAGAGGGAAAGLHIFLHGELVSGIDVIMTALQFAEKLQGADLVITGEGCLDSQTVNYAKAPIGIARKAKAFGIPVIAIVGSVGPGYKAAYQQGMDAIFPLSFDPERQIPANAYDLVVKATRNALLLNGKL